MDKMISFSPDLPEKIAEAMKIALKETGTDDVLVERVTAAAQSMAIQILKNVDSDCCSRIEVANNQIQELRERMDKHDQDRVKQYRELERQNEEREKQYREFERHVKQTEEQRYKHTEQVIELTNKVSRLEHFYRSTEVNRVRDNIVIKTIKTSTEVGEFVAETVKKGCGEKPSFSSFSIQTIVQKKGEITPGKPKKGKPAESQLYKVKMSTKMKNDLYKGLSLGNSRANSDFQVSHDTPRFLVHQKHLYEKMGYAIRSAFKGDVKTRISLRSHNLSLMLKTKESDWVDLTSDQKYLDTPLVIKDGDNFPEGVKTVGDLRKTIVKF